MDEEANRSTAATMEDLDLLTDELIDQLKNLDVPLDFKFETRVDQLDRFDKFSRPLSLHPQNLAEGLTSGVRAETINALLDEVNEQLKNGNETSTSTYDLPALNLKDEVSVGETRAAASGTPARFGVIGHAPLSGYASEAMAEASVKGGLTRKIKRGQGPRSGVAPVSILVVDLTRAREVAQEGEFDPTAITELLGHHLPDDLGGYDAIAVTTSTVADGTGRLLFIASQDKDAGAASLLEELYQ